MAKKFHSKVLAVIHETASDMRSAGVIDRETMRRFDVMCLTQVKPLEASQIRRLRKREKASQAVFASYLNVSPGVVSKWERGEKRPGGPALKLLTLVARKGLQAVA
ncbi:MAG: DNA-binding transcriptional regulator [Alphaproteobacteria bacterium]|nr:DNA-binding transcriptional regulator [Alphaproteobacteria bacterium]